MQALLLFMLTGSARFVGNDIPIVSTFLFTASTLLYFSLIICWAVYIKKRFIQERIRRLLMLMAFFLMLYIFFRTVKYRYISMQHYPMLSRLLWYGYYIPQIFTPLISFVTACEVGKPEEEKLSRGWIWAFVAASLLAVGILTNDLHMFAFRFRENFENWSSDYSYGFLFYIVTAWIYIWLFASIIMLWHKCTVSSIRHRVWLPFIWLPVGTFFVIMLALEGMIGISFPFRLPEIHCFILIAIWESCIQIGLIPCNTGYGEYFSDSSLAAQIADENGTVVYRSENAPELTRQQMKLAKERPILIAKNTLLQSNTVTGGNIFWSEDLTAVNRMNEELTEIGEHLAEESDLLRAENEVKEQKARILEQNRLYDRIALLSKPKLEKISQLLESGGDFNRNISLACVLGCLIKRRANLTLLSDSSETMSANELYLSLRETAEYLKLCGITSSVRLSSDGELSSESVLLAFDFWQLWVESGLLCMTAIMADISVCGDDLVIKITADNSGLLCRNEELAARLCTAGGKISVTEEDETVFVLLGIPKGGEEA